VKDCDRSCLGIQNDAMGYISFKNKRSLYHLFNVFECGFKREHFVPIVGNDGVEKAEGCSVSPEQDSSFKCSLAVIGLEKLGFSRVQCSVFRWG
jgi:hypothetical protein